MRPLPTQRSHAWQRRLATGSLACLLILGALPASATAATKPFTIDLADRNDFVAQTNFVQCVGASMQMMLNIIGPERDRTAATQLELQRLARKWSGRRPDGDERQGASVRGWTAGLNLLGAGPYRLAGEATIDEALVLAARAIRLTGKPVGLLMWRGRHAWVMSGFEATGDPLQADTRVTSVYVEDPLYPHGSSVWGPSPRPGEALTVAELGRQYVPRNASNNLVNNGNGGNPSGGWGRQFAGKYVLVLPFVPLPTLRANADI